MAKYCMYCGRPLNKDGRCPNCSADQYGRSGKKPRKKHSTLTIVLIAVSALLIVLTPVVLIVCDVIRDPFARDAKKRMDDENIVERKETPPEYILHDTVERPDTQEILDGVGTVASRTRLADSGSLQTEAEVFRDLQDRGFTSAPITTAYAADGAYMTEKEISASSDERHPVYQTLYVSKDGAIWSILSVNGKVAANPVSYNNGGYWDTMHLLSETGTLVQYDSAQSAFIEIMPYAEEIVVKTVPRIDAATLDGMTATGGDR